MFRPTLILIILSLTASGVGLQSHVCRTVESAFPQRRSATPVQQRKRALLVGVSDYCRDKSGAECSSHPGRKFWWNLNSKNDVEALEQVLMSEKFGFRKSEIKVLATKEETTRDNIINTFKSFLIEQTSPGDIVYFHFSGHGSQVEDDRLHGENPKIGDELDGADETLIPSDYETRDDGKRNIRDDELEQLLSGLSGRHVTVTVDSCYSGTITRGGLRLVRGMKARRSIVAGSRGVKDGPSGIFAEDAILPRSMVVISAARNNQLASEMVDPATRKDMGALTYSLIRVLTNSGPETTYRDLFEKLNDEITREISGQDPQLEGSRDNVLFSGTVLPPKSYINLKVDGRKVMLRAGSLQGMSTGSRFSIYSLGKDSKTGPPMAKGEIVTIGPTMSVLNLIPLPDDKALEELRTARAFETFHNFGDARIKVVIENMAKASLGEEGLRELKTLDLLNFADRANDWDVRMCRAACENEKLTAGQQNGGPGVMTLMRDDGSIIRRLPEGPGLQDSIRIALEGEARWRLIKTLKNETDPNLRIKMRLVPVTKVEQDLNTKLARSAVDLASEVQPSQGNQLVLHDGDTVMLEVMNLGTEEPYVSVLDLRSDGNIAPLFPHPRVRVGVNENRFQIKNDKEGKPVWQRIPFPFVIQIDKPYGHEIFKAIITRDPTDFSALFLRGDAEDIQGGRRRGTKRGENEAKSPLGKILLTATTGKARGKRGDTRGSGLVGAEDAANIGVPVEDWATAEITFEARPPRTASQSPK